VERSLARIDTSHPASSGKSSRIRRARLYGSCPLEHAALQILRRRSSSRRPISSGRIDRRISSNGRASLKNEVSFWVIASTAFERSPSGWPSFSRATRSVAEAIPSRRARASSLASAK
jgi:hypothetical protein